jgi:flavin reductase (DIM6/NTAB) family NADH-FMN oxidoreductase RutF
VNAAERDAGNAVVEVSTERLPEGIGHGDIGQMTVTPVREALPGFPDPSYSRSLAPTVGLAGYGVGADHFRKLAGSVPTGVSVITTVEDGLPVGMTSGTVCSLSCEPPLVLFCIGRSAQTLTSIRRLGRFGVNILSSAGAGLSTRFAGPVEDRFTGVRWHHGPGCVPILDEAVTAWLACKLYEVLDGGDHAIVVGLIVDGHETDAAPLVYHRRAYAGFGTD